MLVPSRVVPFLFHPALSRACPVPRSFLFASRVVLCLSHPALSLSCYVPRYPMLVPSRVVSFLSRPPLPHVRATFHQIRIKIENVRLATIFPRLRRLHVVCILIGSLDWQSPF